MTQRDRKIYVIEFLNDDELHVEGTGMVNEGGVVAIYDVDELQALVPMAGIKHVAVADNRYEVFTA